MRMYLADAADSHQVNVGSTGTSLQFSLSLEG